MDCREWAEKTCGEELKFLLEKGIWMSPKAQKAWLEGCIEEKTETCIELRERLEVKD